MRCEVAVTGASSVSVPKLPQLGHFPNQRPVEYPHSEHANDAAAFAFATEPV